jgi:hypothetical protein
MPRYMNQYQRRLQLPSKSLCYYLEDVFSQKVVKWWRKGDGIKGGTSLQACNVERSICDWGWCRSICCKALFVSYIYYAP